MIVVEGPDGGGKTRMVNRIMEESRERGVELSLVPRSVDSNQTFLTDLQIYTDQYLNRGFGPRIHDRFTLISEPIYGPLCRGEVKPGFAGDWYGRAWRRFLGFNPIVVICLPPREVVLRNVQDTPQPTPAIQRAGAVWDSYAVLFQRHRTLWQHWDYTQSSKINQAVMAWILSTIQRRIGGR